MCPTCVWETREPEKGVRSPGATVIGDCESPRVSAENHTLLLWTNKKCLNSPAISPDWAVAFTEDLNGQGSYTQVQV